MRPSAYFAATSTIFGLVAIMHAVRLILHLQANFAGVAIPMWVSWAGVAGAGLLSVWGFSLMKGK
jgi:hypothetical protein